MTSAPPMPQAQAGAPPIPPGSTAPATTAPDSQGMRQRGHILVGTLVTKLLEEAVKLLGSTSPEGQDALKALTALSKRFGPAGGDLSRAEAKLLGERAAPVTTPGPENLPAMQSAIRSRLAGHGLGAGG